MIFHLNYIIPCVGMPPRRRPETDHSAPIQVKCIIRDRPSSPAAHANLVLVLDSRHNENASVTNSMPILFPRLLADLAQAGFEPQADWLFVEIDTTGSIDIITTHSVEAGIGFLGWKPYGDRRIGTLLSDIRRVDGDMIASDIGDWIAEHGYQPSAGANPF